MQVRGATRIGHAQNNRRALSLSEVLVVLAILLFLVALLLPSMSAAREQVRRVMCSNNLRQWGVAYHYYREDYNDFLPTEGAYIGEGIIKPGTWFNELPPYLGLPPYRDFEGANLAIRELPNIHVWICPSKNLTEAYKSGSGKNQFHYGMNQVLDGLGSEEHPSRDAPGHFDLPGDPVRAVSFAQEPGTVLMFDIAPNSMAGTPRNVATSYQRDFEGRYIGKFHGDYANILFLNGSGGHCKTDDLVTNHDFSTGTIRWDHRRLYWGYPPP